MVGTRVLDSYALLAFLGGEAGADEVRRLLLRAEEGNAKLAMTTVNLSEVWYVIARSETDDVADRFVQDIQGMAVEIVDVDWGLARQAAHFKAKAGISYADCFVAALAKARKGEIVTGDREFKRVEDEVRIAWLASR